MIDSLSDPLSEDGHARQSRAKSPASGLKVTQITPLCQLQDLGRWGYKNNGVTQSGAMDPYSLKVANALVGNPLASACLELSLAGASFEVQAHSLRVALAGDFPLWVNEVLQPSFCSIHLKAGDQLRIGAAQPSAIRGYLAVAGGFAVTPSLGSCSTHLRSGIGGFATPMQVGAILATVLDFAPVGRESALPRHQHRPTRRRLRVVLGPQHTHFTLQGVQDFFEAEYRVSQASDRMGYRLMGPRIEHAGDGNIISDPTLLGSIQVPASGQPLVLMSDGPTTGGYPKIATLASVDRGVLAQKGPDARVRFEAISVAKAQALLREEAAFFGRLNRLLDVVG